MIRGLVFTKVPIPNVVAPTGFATQTKPAQPENAGISALDTFNLSVNPRDIMRTQEVGVCLGEVCWPHHRL